MSTYEIRKQKWTPRSKSRFPNFDMSDTLDWMILTSCVLQTQSHMPGLRPVRGLLTAQAVTADGVSRQCDM